MSVSLLQALQGPGQDEGAQVTCNHIGGAGQGALLLWFTVQQPCVAGHPSALQGSMQIVQPPNRYLSWPTLQLPPEQWPFIPSCMVQASTEASATHSSVSWLQARQGPGQFVAGLQVVCNGGRGWPSA